MRRLALLATSLLVGVAFGANLRLGAAPATPAAAQATERVFVDMTVEAQAGRRGTASSPPRGR